MEKVQNGVVSAANHWKMDKSSEVEDVKVKKTTKVKRVGLLEVAVFKIYYKVSIFHFVSANKIQ